MTTGDWESYRSMLFECMRNESLWMIGSADEEQESLHADNIKKLDEEIKAIDEGDYERVFEMNGCETEKEFEEKYGYA